MAPGRVQVRFSVGFGNNLCQYVVGRLLAEQHGCALTGVFLAHDEYGAATLRDLGVVVADGVDPGDRAILVGDSGLPLPQLLGGGYGGRDFLVEGHFEDYRIYGPYLARIRSWFRQVPVVFPADLVMHFRLGDRLVDVASYQPGMFLPPECYVDAVRRFDCERVHVVTDLPDWRKLEPGEIRALRYHNGDAAVPGMDYQMAADYLARVIDAFDEAGFIVHGSGYAAAARDFDLLRQFGQILFQHSTFAWWAAVLSGASRIGAYGPWRPAKGARNKNMGYADYPGWFSWGADLAATSWCGLPV